MKRDDPFVATLTLGQLLEHIEERVSQVLKKHSAGDAETLPLTQAAKAIGRRYMVVLEAVRAGEIQAKQSGNRWRVNVASLRRWSNK